MNWVICSSESPAITWREFEGKQSIIQVAQSPWIILLCMMLIEEFNDHPREISDGFDL